MQNYDRRVFFIRKAEVTVIKGTKDANKKDKSMSQKKRKQKLNENSTRKCRKGGNYSLSPLQNMSNKIVAWLHHLSPITEFLIVKVPKFSKNKTRTNKRGIETRA